METESHFPIDAQKLILHRKPMCQIDHLVEVTEKSGTVSTSVLADNVLLDEDGLLDRLALVEMIAQTYAALKGYASRRAGKPINPGFLVGIRKFAVYEDVQLGDRIMVHVEMIKEFGGFALAKGDILRGDVCIATGIIKLWDARRVFA